MCLQKKYRTVKNVSICRKYHGLTILGCVLSGISTILSMLPFVCIWFAIRDFIHVLGQGNLTLAASNGRLRKIIDDNAGLTVEYIRAVL